MAWHQTYKSSSSDTSLIKSLIYFLRHHSACFRRPCWWHWWAVGLTFMSILEENWPTIWILHKVINSLGLSNTIWWHRSGSTLAQVMACCLMAPSHYLNQCWLIISKVQLHSSEGTFIPGISTSDHYLTWTLISSNLNQFFRSQWVEHVCVPTALKYNLKKYYSLMANCYISNSHHLLKPGYVLEIQIYDIFTGTKKPYHPGCYIITSGTWRLKCKINSYICHCGSTSDNIVEYFSLVCRRSGSRGNLGKI